MLMMSPNEVKLSNFLHYSGLTMIKNKHDKREYLFIFNSNMIRDTFI